MEYDVQSWSSNWQGDIEKTEKVHRRATTILIGFIKLKYEEILKILSLTTLKDMRLICDLIEMYEK